MTANTETGSDKEPKHESTRVESKQESQEHATQTNDEAQQTPHQCPQCRKQGQHKINT